MTVKELKEKLQQFPDEMEVVSSLVDYGFTTIDSVVERTVFVLKGKQGFENWNESNYDWGDKNISERKKIKAVNLAYQDFGDDPDNESTEEEYNEFQERQERERLNTPTSQMFATAYVNPVFMGVGQREMVKDLNGHEPKSPFSILSWVIIFAIGFIAALLYELLIQSLNP